MAITKQYLKTKPICKVTFVVPAKEASSVCVAGEFNNWNTEATMLKKLKNGNFKGTIDLPKDNQFEFKYVVDVSGLMKWKQMGINGVIMLLQKIVY